MLLALSSLYTGAQQIVTGTLSSALGSVENVSCLGKIGVGGSVSSSAGYTDLNQTGHEGKTAAFATLFSELGLSCSAKTGFQGPLVAEALITGLLSGVLGVQGTNTSTIENAGSNFNGQLGQSGALVSDLILLGLLSGKLGIQGAGTLSIENIQKNAEGKIGSSGSLLSELSITDLFSGAFEASGNIGDFQFFLSIRSGQIDVTVKSGTGEIFTRSGAIALNSNSGEIPINLRQGVIIQ